MATLDDRPLVFVAVHTSGSDETVHEVIDLAIVDEDGDSLLHTAIAPQALASANPDALAENGYSPGEWAPSPLFGAKARQILGHLTGPLVAGYDTQFHMRFLNRLMRSSFEAEELDPEEVDAMMARIYPMYVDAMSLAYEQLGDLGGLKSLSLEDVAKFLKIPYEPNHSALMDARTAQQVYTTLFQAGPFRRWWWKWTAPS
jgi:DNA polymerase III epsilon subunit-like protein